METNMNTKKLVSAVVAMSLATTGLAFGQGYGDRDQQAQRGDQQDRRNNDGARPDRRQDRGGANNRNEQRDERGAGPNHEFRRGGRLPTEYRHSQYVVDDWRGHNLSAPPRGYHWVQTGGDYVLVAIATGVILQLLLNH
jgi:Ni/Co efflux regulator RcnB